MPKRFILDIKTARDSAQFRLLNAENDALLAAHEVQIKDHSSFDWESIFDTQNHIQRYANNLRPNKNAPMTEAELLLEAGLFIGSKVLGEKIMAELYKSKSERTLLIRLPKAEDDLACAFLHVPWEIARSDEASETLMARNLAVQAISEGFAAEDHESSLDLVDNLRVLLIFAHAPDLSPLNLRLERT